MTPDLTFPVTNPVEIIALVMFILLVVPLLFTRMRAPAMIGLLLAGVAVGPNALHLLARDPTMVLLGTVGLLYIMFIAGLEFDLEQFQKHRSHSLLFGLATYALPQGLGTLVARTVLGFDWLSALLLGSVFASHTLLAYPIVSRLGIAKSNAVTTAVGATLFTDTLALLVLAVIAGSVEGGFSITFVLQLIGLLGLLVVGLLWTLPRLGRWFYRLPTRGETTEFAFVLTIVFTAAFLAEVIGIEAIIGAFLAGLGLNRLIPEQSPLMLRLRFVGDALFIPFFLIATGMLVDLRVLFSDPRAWLVAGAMLTTVTATKWLAAMTTRLLFGYSWEEGQIVFSLSIPQAAATLAAVLIGFDVGLFDTDVLNGAILMILVTCFIGPWLAERYGRRLALREEAAAYEVSSAPQRILVPLANPHTAPGMMDLALLLRDPRSDQPLYPLTVAQDGPQVQTGVIAAEKMLGRAILHAAAADVPVLPLLRVDLNAARGILRAITEARISTVVLGWDRAPVAQRFVFGRISDQLLEERRVTILLCRITAPLNATRRVFLLVPPLADYASGFGEALRTAKCLSRRVGARLVLVTDAAHMPPLTAAVQKMKPEAAFDTHRLPSWSSLLEALDGLPGPDDLLVLISARHGTRSWSSLLEQLPRTLAQRFGTNNLILLYPAERSGSLHASPLRPGDLPAPIAPSPLHIVLELEQAPLAAVLRQLLQRRFEEEPEVLRHLVPILEEMQEAYTPELAPGVVFYHAHTAALTGTEVFVGVSRRGLDLPHTTGRIHLVLVLLSATSVPSQQHLQHLTLLIRRVLREEMVERLRSAASAAEVQEAWEEVLRDSVME